MCEGAMSAFEFFQRYPNGDTARKHFESIRLGGKPYCPFCDEVDRIQKRKRIGYYRCLSCKKDFTVRTGTIFARSNVPMHKWFYGIYLVMVACEGLSSLRLSKELGITQKSAWFMAQRIREACSGDASKLSGIVEIDETYIGGEERNKHASKKLRASREAVGKQTVMGMRERKGRVRQC